MGLDAVELVMAIEEEFGIDISDAEAEAMATPRALIDFIWGKHLRGELFVKPPRHPSVLQRLGWKGTTERSGKEVVASRDTVAARVREIITDQTGITKFSDDDRFIDDMNMG